MKEKRPLAYLLISLFLVFCFIRCGSNNEKSPTLKNSDNVLVTKSGKIGINDIAVENSTNIQKKPALAFDAANNRFLAVWTEVKSTGKDILGKWIYLKTMTSGSQSFTFPITISRVVAYDSNDNEINPQSVTGLNSNTVTVTASSGTTLLFLSTAFTIQPNAADNSDFQTPNPVVAYGSDYVGNQNFVVTWSDYKNDGASITSPKIIGKVYDKNCNETKKFYAAGSATTFYTYSATLYNLKNDVTSQGQYEPSVAFDNYNKRFVIAWVDKNSIENNYLFAPRSGVVSALTNSSVTAESKLFDSSSGIVDDKVVVYRYFDINGNPVKDPNDISSKRSIILYSDVDVESSSTSGDVTLTLNNIRSFKFETSPKVACDSAGNLLVAFKGRQITSSGFFNYSSDGFPNTYINRGPFVSNVTSSATSPNDIFIRNLKPVKNMEGKLYSTQLSNPDKSVASADIDSFDVVNLSDKRFIITWSQNDGGVSKIKANLFDLSSFSLGAAADVAADKNSYNPKVALTSNGEVFIVFECYDSDTAIRKIYGRYLLQTLAGDSDNFQISTGAGTKNYNPAVATDDNGRAFIFFEDDSNNSNLNIFGTLYTRKSPLVKPSLFLPYTSINFGTVYIDSVAKSYLPLTNYGNGDLNITGATIANPFQAISSVQTVSPNSTKYIGVKFTPSQAGSFITQLSITTDDSSKSTVTVTVKGTSQAGVIINLSGFKDKADLKSDYYAKLTATTPSQLQTNYEWSVVKGSLPDGISLDKNTGVLSGKATKTGTFDFEIKVKETNSGLTSASTPLKIEVYDDIAYAEKGSFKCFIATAAYGSYLDPHVAVLREFRDKVLLGTLTVHFFGKRFVIENYFGKFFVKRYYKYSPAIASFIAKSELLKFITRVILTPFVFFIKYFSHMFLIFFAVILAGTLRKR
ncbi:MAG: hypothetical protein OHK0040_01190 [bacterium]